MAWSGTPEEVAAKKKAWNDRRLEAERQQRATLKELGLTIRQYRALKMNQRTETPEDTGTVPRRPLVHKKDPNKYGKGSYKEDRALVAQLVEDQPFIQRLGEIPDTSSSSITCPACRRTDASWEEYFCRYCGEHNDKLYLKDHAQAPISLTREEIVAEYQSVGLTFAPGVNPSDSGLRNLSYAELTGINPWAEMKASKERLNRWDLIQGFRTPDQEFSPST